MPEGLMDEIEFVDSKMSTPLKNRDLRVSFNQNFVDIIPFFYKFYLFDLRRQA